MKKSKHGRKVMWVLKSLMASYIVTGLLLLALTFGVYKFQLEETIVVGTLVAIYVVSTFTGGFILGKLMGVHKFLWGFIVGAIYFLLLFGISYGIYREFNTNGLHSITTALLCVGGGMLGGMLS